MKHRPLPLPVCRAGLCLLALCLLLSLPVSCARRMPDTADILGAMCASQPSLPAGQVYLHTAVLGDAGYADEELLAALFGNGELPIELSSVNAYAFRLCSFAEPHEFAVFLCVSAQDAYAVAEMCIRRTDRIRYLCRGTEYEAIADDARVSVCGKYVLLAVGQDALTAIEAGRRAIRG